MWRKCLDFRGVMSAEHLAAVETSAELQIKDLKGGNKTLTYERGHHCLITALPVNQHNQIRINLGNKVGDLNQSWFIEADLEKRFCLCHEKIAKRGIDLLKVQFHQFRMRRVAGLQAN